jgi:hypothetical protein
MTDARGRVRVHDRQITLDDFNLAALGGRVGLTGFYETKDIARPTFDFDLAIDSIDIAGAFGTLATVQRLAPIAQFARGSFSADLSMNGPLGGDMAPLFELLSGQGSFLTSRVEVLGFPPLNLIADRLKLEQLRDPAFKALSSTVAIYDGRLHVTPFDVEIGDALMRVSGSNGIDQTVDYSLALAVPRSLMGSAANDVVDNLITRAGRTGINLQPSDVIQLGVKLTGTIRDPSVNVDFSGVTTSVSAGVQQAVVEAVDRQVGEVSERVDSAKAEAVRRAQAEADRMVREAEERAATIRSEARVLADSVKARGNAQADELLARATNPIARAAAGPAADRLRKESDARATQIVQEADRKADELVAEARRRGAILVSAAGG